MKTFKNHLSIAIIVVCLLGCSKGGLRYANTRFTNSFFKNLLVSTLFWDVKVKGNQYVSEAFFEPDIFDCEHGGHFFIGENGNFSNSVSISFASITNNNIRRLLPFDITGESVALNDHICSKYEGNTICIYNQQSITVPGVEMKFEYFFYGDYTPYFRKPGFVSNNSLYYYLLANVKTDSPNLPYNYLGVKIFSVVSESKNQTTHALSMSLSTFSNSIILSTSTKHSVMACLVFDSPAISIQYVSTPSYNSSNDSESDMSNKFDSWSNYNYVYLLTPIISTENFPYIKGATGAPLVTGDSYSSDSIDYLYTSALVFVKGVDGLLPPFKYYMILLRTKFTGEDYSEIKHNVLLGTVNFTSTYFLAIRSTTCDDSCGDISTPSTITIHLGNVGTDDLLANFHFTIEDNSFTLNATKTYIYESLSITDIDTRRRMLLNDGIGEIGNFEEIQNFTTHGTIFNEIRNKTNYFGSLKKNNSNKNFGFIFELEEKDLLSASSNFLNGYIFEDDGNHFHSQIIERINKTAYSLGYCFKDNSGTSSVRHHVIDKASFEPASEDCQDFFTKAIFKVVDHPESIISDIAVTSLFNNLNATFNITDNFNLSNETTLNRQKSISKINLCEDQDLTKSPDKSDSQKEQNTNTNNKVWHIALILGATALIFCFCCCYCFKLHNRSKTYYNFETGI